MYIVEVMMANGAVWYLAGAGNIITPKREEAYEFTDKAEAFEKASWLDSGYKHKVREVTP